VRFRWVAILLVFRITKPLQTAVVTPILPHTHQLLYQVGLLKKPVQKVK